MTLACVLLCLKEIIGIFDGLPKTGILLMVKSFKLCMVHLHADIGDLNKFQNYISARKTK